MGNLCGSDELNEVASSYEALSNLKQSSFRMSLYTQEMRNAANVSLNDDSFISNTDSPKNDEDKLNNYYSMILSKNKDETGHFPPSSMRQKYMNKKGQVALEQLNELCCKSDMKKELENWKNVNDYPTIGPIFYDDGSTYNGQFLKGQKCGYGELVFPDGSFYMGMWKDDQKHGKGVFAFADGDVILAFFKSDKLNGEGKIFF